MASPSNPTLETAREAAWQIGDRPAADVSTLAVGARLSLAGKIGGRGLSLLGDILAARILGPESFGLYAIGWTILRSVGLVSPLGLDKGVIFFATPWWRKNAVAVRSVVYRSLGWALTSGIAIGAVFFLSAPWLADRVFMKPALVPILRWFSLSFPLLSLLTVASAATRVTQRMEYSAAIQDLLQPAAGLLLMVLFFFFGLRLTGVLASDVLSFAVACILIIAVAGRLFPRGDCSGANPAGPTRQLLAFSLPASLAGVFTPFLVWVDRLLVGYFRTPAETGIYQAASQTSVLSSIILTAIAAIFVPMISDLHTRGEYGRLEEMYRISTKWGLYLSLPVYALTIVFPREILGLVFGANYQDGWLPLVILSTGQLVNVATGAAGSMLIMTGHPRRWSLLSGIALVVNIGLNLILVPRFGLAGAALGTAASLSALFLVAVLQIKALMNVWPYDRRFGKGILAAAAVLGILIPLRLGFGIYSLWTLGIICTAAWAVFLLVFWTLGADEEDRELLRLGRGWLSRFRGAVPSGEQEPGP